MHCVTHKYKSLETNNYLYLPDAQNEFQNGYLSSNTNKKVLNFVKKKETYLYISSF